MSANNTSPKDICKAETYLNLHSISCLGRKAKLIFDVLVSFSNNYIDVYPARETIAFRVGCDISYVDKVIAYLVEIGAIIKINRPKRQSNLYKLNAIFYITEIREQLRHIFSSFSTWGMASLMRAKSLFKGNESLSICTYNYNNSRTEKNREWTAKDDMEFIQKIENENKLPVNVLKRLNQSIFKRLAEITMKKWNSGKEERIAETKRLAAAAASAVRYKPTQEQLNKLLKKVEHNV